MKHVKYIDRYFDENLNSIKNECVSKVYDVRPVRYPSGMVTKVKVWNNRLNSMVYIRADREIIEVID